MIKRPADHVAHREAGHAVMMTLLGRDFTAVTIEGQGIDPAVDQAGPPGARHLTRAGGTIADLAHRGITADDRQVLELARPLGGDIFTATDENGLLSAGNRFTAGQIRHLWRQCEQYAAAAMPAIEAAAAALLDRGTLDRADVAELADAALNGARPTAPEWVSWDLAAWNEWQASTCTTLAAR